MNSIENKTWMNIISVIDFESDTSNFKVNFKVLTKKYGKSYIELCKLMWSTNNDVLTVDEFCKLNGEIPINFFNKVINKKTM